MTEQEKKHPILTLSENLTTQGLARLLTAPRMQEVRLIETFLGYTLSESERFAIVEDFELFQAVNAICHANDLNLGIEFNRIKHLWSFDPSNA